MLCREMQWEEISLTFGSVPVVLECVSLNQKSNLKEEKRKKCDAHAHGNQLFFFLVTLLEISITVLRYLDTLEVLCVLCPIRRFADDKEQLKFLEGFIATDGVKTQDKAKRKKPKRKEENEKRREEQRGEWKSREAMKHGEKKQEAEEKKVR